MVECGGVPVVHEGLVAGVGMYHEVLCYGLWPFGLSSIWCRGVILRSVQGNT